MHHAVNTWLKRHAPDVRCRPARSGQTLVLGALVMTAIIAMSGLTIDVGVWLVGKARLQRAVDTAALSVVLDRPTTPSTVMGGNETTFPPTQNANQKALAIITGQGIPVDQLTQIRTYVPRTNRFLVEATQRVPTAFARVIGVDWADIQVRATADINSFIEIPVSPLCGGSVGAGAGVVCDGGVGDSTMDQFGVNRSHTNGDSYSNPTSPYYNNPDGTRVIPNGYLYRVAIDPGYTGDLVIQVWDPDNFNKHNPNQYIGACPTADLSPCTPNPTYDALNDLRDRNPSMPSIARNYYADGYHLFWRVDECNTGSAVNCSANAEMTPIEFTMWRLDPDAPDPLNPLPGERIELGTVSYGPTAASCAVGGGSNCDYVYTCTDDASNGNITSSSCPDLRWVEMFRINTDTLPAQVDGSKSIFIDILPIGQTTNTENVYHLRSGPPPGSADQNPCQHSGAWGSGRSAWEDANDQINCQWQNGRPGGNTKIYARRSMPVNVMQAADGSVPYVVWLGWVPKEAAGQRLQLRNYDLDRPGASCTPPANSTNGVRYTAFFPGRASGSQHVDLTIGGNLYSCGSANGVWVQDDWTAPSESGGWWGSDDGFWLYANVFQKTGGAPFWDTAVFEVLFERARLVT